MNKKLVALCALFATNSVFAQTSDPAQVSLYGILDVAVGKVENSLNVDPNFPSSVNPVSATPSTVNKSVTGMFNGGIQDSRWGIRGTDDLGGGMKAFFTLESGIDIADGALNNAAASLASNSPVKNSVSANSSLDGQLFNRLAFVGLSDNTLGSLAFGRNYGPIYDIAVNYDPVQDAQLFSPLGFSGTLGGGGGVSEDTRLDSSIKYKNKIGAVNIGAVYKFGGIAGNTSAQSGYAVNLGYEEGPLGVQLAYESFRDALKSGNSTVAADINVTNYNTSSYFIAAKYVMGQFTIRGGDESYTLEAPSNAFASLGISNLWGYAIGNASGASANFSAASQTTDVRFIGGDYNFTPAFNLAIGFYDQNPKASSDRRQLDGNIYSYSALLDYHFSKRTDVYAGWMLSSYKGANYTAPFAADNSSNYITAVGMRTRF